MASSNDELLDAVIRHQIGLMRLSGKIRKDIVRLLDSTENDLRNRIESMLVGDITAPATLRRLEKLDAVIREIRAGAISEVLGVWQQEFRDLTVAEASFMGSAIKTVSPVLLDVITPEVARLRALVTSNPFEGRTLKEWAVNVANADVSRIMSQVKIGMVQGESSAEIARRVVGTAQLKGKDGVTEITRRNAAAITRTATNFYSNEAKKLLFIDNSDLFTEELFVATLDGLTTAVCRSLDGETFPIGVGPRPALHFGCRSVRVALLASTALGTRPMKPTTEKLLLKEYAKDNHLAIVTKRANLPYGMKGSFDAFSRRRVRELTGQVPAKVNYSQFLKRQSTDFQDEVLGVTKGRLFRKGSLDLDRFVDKKGAEYTLAELAIRDKTAFIKAGLDPSGF